MSMVLEGVRIIDLTMYMHGPYGTRMLADMGAEVIKVEDVSGDRFRHIDRGLSSGHAPPSDINYNFELANRGKKSIAIDLRKETGRVMIHRLVAKSDVFVSNIRQETLNEWGMDYQSLERFNPQLIWVHASGFGPKGPDRNLRAFDIAVQARGGLLSVTGEDDTPPPPWGTPTIGDTTGSMHIAYGIVLALLARERLGIGQQVFTSQLGAQIELGGLVFSGYLATGQEYRKSTRKKILNPLRNSYQAKDGRWMCIAIGGMQDQLWPAFCEALRIEELRDDPRFNSAYKRGENAEELVPFLDQAFTTKTAQEWKDIFARYELPFGVVQNYAELATDPQVVENEYVIALEHPIHGIIKQPGITVKLSKSPGKVRGPAPRLAQHTQEVLMDIAGYSREELNSLREQGVIL